MGQCIYINQEGVRVNKTEELFEGIQDEVTRLQRKGFNVVLMGDLMHILDLEMSNLQTWNGQRLVNLVWSCDLMVGNELSECRGRWTRECGEKRSMTDYILLSRSARVHRMVIEDEGAEELGSDHNLTTT